MTRWRRGSADGRDRGASFSPPTEELLKTLATDLVREKATEAGMEHHEAADMKQAQPQAAVDAPMDMEEWVESAAPNASLSWRADGFSSPCNQLSMPKPSRSRVSTSSEDLVARAPPSLVSQHKPGQQQLLPPKQSSSASQAQALREVHWLMNNGSEEERRSALRTLAALSSAENLPAGLLAETIRTAKGCVEFLCSMLMDETLVEAALVALGNFGIEANEDDMLRVVSAGGIEQIFKVVSKATLDDALLVVALGACMNVCNGIEAASLACEMGLFVHLHELAASSDPAVRRFASSALSNIQMSIIECVRNEPLVESDHLGEDETTSPQLAAFYLSVSSYFKRRGLRSALVQWAHAADVALVPRLAEGSRHGNDVSHRQSDESATPLTHHTPMTGPPNETRTLHPEGPGGAAGHGLCPRRPELPLHGPARQHMAMQLPIDDMEWLSSRWAMHKGLAHAWRRWRRASLALHACFVRQVCQQGMAAWRSLVARRQGAKRTLGRAEVAFRQHRLGRAMARFAAGRARAKEVELSWLQAVAACEGRLCRRAVGRWAQRHIHVHIHIHIHIHIICTYIYTYIYTYIRTCTYAYTRRAVGRWAQRRRERIGAHVSGEAVQMEAALVSRRTARRTHEIVTRWRAASAALKAAEQRKVDRVYRQSNFQRPLTRWVSHVVQAASELALSERAARRMSRCFKYTAFVRWMQQMVAQMAVTQQMTACFKGTAFVQWVRWAHLALDVMAKARRITGGIAELAQHRAWSRWLSYRTQLCIASAMARRRQASGFKQWVVYSTSRQELAGFDLSAKDIFRQRGLAHAIHQWELFRGARLSTHAIVAQLEKPSTITQRRALALWFGCAVQWVDDYRTIAMCYRRQGLARAMDQWAEHAAAAAEHAGAAAHMQSASQWATHKGITRAWMSWRRTARLLAASQACFVRQGHQRGMAACVGAVVRRRQILGLTQRAEAHWVAQTSTRKRRRALALWSGLKVVRGRADRSTAVAMASSKRSHQRRSQAVTQAATQAVTQAVTPAVTTQAVAQADPQADPLALLIPAIAATPPTCISPYASRQCGVRQGLAAEAAANVKVVAWEAATATAAGKAAATKAAPEEEEVARLRAAAAEAEVEERVAATGGSAMVDGTEVHGADATALEAQVATEAEAATKVLQAAQGGSVGVQGAGYRVQAARASRVEAVQAAEAVTAVKQVEEEAAAEAEEASAAEAEEAAAKVAGEAAAKVAGEAAQTAEEAAVANQAEERRGAAARSAEEGETARLKAGLQAPARVRVKEEEEATAAAEAEAARLKAEEEAARAACVRVEAEEEARAAEEAEAARLKAEAAAAAVKVRMRACVHACMHASLHACKHASMHASIRPMWPG